MRFLRHMKSINPMCLRVGWGLLPPSRHIVLMSFTGVSLSGVLASKNRLRFTRYGQCIRKTVNDVLALNSVNDVLAFKS